MGHEPLVMYASPDSIRQVYSSLYDDVGELDTIKGESYSGGIKAKLGNILGSLSSEVEGEVNRGTIEKINFDDSYKTKSLVHELLFDSELPDIDEIGETGNPNQPYCFSTECALSLEESEIDDEKTIRVVGVQDDVKFKGYTSVENWGSRSDLLMALKIPDTYPFQGIIYPMNETNTLTEIREFQVQYLIICKPSKEMYKRYRNRSHLINNEMPNERFYPTSDELK